LFCLIAPFLILLLFFSPPQQREFAADADANATDDNDYDVDNDDSRVRLSHRSAADKGKEKINQGYPKTFERKFDSCHFYILL
jgi:hypothetical protein